MSKPPFRVRAIYEYLSEHDDDLSFPNGQIICVTEEEDADWYYGEYDDNTGGKHKGLFPRNFVKAYEPETPPRPSRWSRSKKDLESVGLVNEGDAKSQSGPASHAPPEVDFGREPQEKLAAVGESASHGLPTSAETTKASEESSKTNVANKSLIANPAKPESISGPEKPVIGSFRDRINAFNKPAAPPVAPMKHGGLGAAGGSNFIKKPFVAPPPSKNAYVHLPPGPPLQKPYRRDEDPEITGDSANTNAVEQSVGSPRLADATAEEDIPKPTSLKDRIALLQKQQMEQAARLSEAAQKKEKPKRPPKKRMESQDRISMQDDQAEHDSLERMNSGETSGRPSMDIPGDDLLTGPVHNVRQQKSRNATPLASPSIKVPREFLSDANDADQSGAGDTEDGDEFSTGRDDSDSKPRHKTNAPPRKPAQALKADSEDEEMGADQEDDEEEEEEELDPEVRRRMEIRERMAKMSGGMGMAGMFGPVGGLQQFPSKKQSSTPNERKSLGNAASILTDPPASRAPPVPTMPIPGMQRVRTPDEEEESSPRGTHRDTVDVGFKPQAVYTDRDSEEIHDTEDPSQEPLPPSRKSTERTIPSIPYGQCSL